MTNKKTGPDSNHKQESDMDVSRLDDRVRKLQTHFALTAKDIDQIVTSTEKVTKRGQKIEALEFGPSGTEPDEAPIRTPAIRGAESRSGQLRLRVVDEADA